MAITTREQLATAYKNPYVYHYYKYSSGLITPTAWCRVDSYVQAGVPPAGADIGGYSLSSAGAVPLPAPAAGNTWYLTELQALGNTDHNAWWLYDRYCSSSTFTAGTAATFTVSNCALPARVTDQNSGHQVWLVSQSSNNTASTVTMSYTNSSGTAGRVGTLIGGVITTPGAVPGQAFGPFTLQTGDTGVRSVQSVTFNAITGGTWQVLMAKPLAATFATGNIREAPRPGWAELGLVDVGTNPCLFVMQACGSNVQTQDVVMTFVQG